MIIGSLASHLCAGGGFCAGSDDIVEHQRISSASYTFSAALPAMLATTASETITMLQENPDLLVQLRENIKALRAQLDPRSEWMRITSAADNPIQLLVLKPDVVASRNLSAAEQELLIQDIVDEVLAQGVLTTRLKSMPAALGVPVKDQGWLAQPALKVCVTVGLTRKEMEKAGTVVRHAITKVVGKRK